MTRSSLIVGLSCLLACGLPGALSGCASHRAERGELPPLASTDAYLQRLVGEWDIERSIRGKVVGNRLSVAPVLGGRYVQLHMISTSPADPYEAIVLVGRDAESGDYIAHWCDSFGPGYSAAGRGTLVGQRLELRFDYPSGPFFNTWEFDPAADRWSFTGESGQPDGTRKPFARDTVTRRGGR